MCWRRSLPTGLPVTLGSPQMPSTSSTAWKAIPRWRPKSASASTVAAGAPARMAPSARRARQERPGLARLHVQALLHRERASAARRPCPRPGRRSSPAWPRRGAPAARTRSAVGSSRRTCSAKRGEGVAGDDGVADAVLGPQRRAVPPFEVAVDDVVVDEREVVDELDRDRADDAGVLVGPGGSRRDAARARRARTCPHRRGAGSRPAEAPGSGGARPPPAPASTSDSRPCQRLRAATLSARRAASREESAVTSSPPPAVAGPRCRAPEHERQRLRGRLVAAADRTFHRRRPSGVAPGSGEEQPGYLGPAPAGGAHRTPGAARKVAARSRVTTASITRASRAAGKSSRSASTNCDTSSGEPRPM